MGEGGGAEELSGLVRDRVGRMVKNVRGSGGMHAVVGVPASALCVVGYGSLLRRDRGAWGWLLLHIAAVGGLISLTMRGSDVDGRWP